MKAKMEKSLLWFRCAIFSGAIFFLLGPVAGMAATVEKKNFDHFETGFPLSGQHQTVPCAACHLRGVFKGTPFTCGGCHNSSIATGKPSEHAASTSTCENCHTIFYWQTATVELSL